MFSLLELTLGSVSFYQLSMALSERIKKKMLYLLIQLYILSFHYEHFLHKSHFKFSRLILEKTNSCQEDLINAEISNYFEAVKLIRDVVKSNFDDFIKLATDSFMKFMEFATRTLHKIQDMKKEEIYPSFYHTLAEMLCEVIIYSVSQLMKESSEL